jgi:uncharacterized membrane protein/ketosteroid isomerase-like protein
MSAGNAATALVALLHAGFLILETFFWDKPLGLRVFGHPLELARASKVLAANQGLYNGFLAAGLAWGLCGGGQAVKMFFLSCVVVAGVFGAATANVKILWVQAVPAALALLLLLRSGGNKRTVEEYMAAFRVSDHARVLACLTDDVEWTIPGAFTKKGKKEFDAEIENPAFEGRPEIKVTRLTEENDVVTAEGTVLTRKKGGAATLLAFSDVFELRGGKIRRLTSYLMETK